MSNQEKVFFKGKKMSELEIKDFFLKKAASRTSSFDTETQRLISEIEDFKSNWIEEAIGKFLDSKKGQEFIKEHEDKTPDKVFEILVRESNLAGLYNAALKRKIKQLQGAVS